MAWGDPGVSIPIYQTDQTINVSNWGAYQNNPQSQRIQSAGYVRGLRLRMPSTTFPATLGTGTLAGVGDAQLAPYRAIQRFQISTQIVNDLLNVPGTDLYIMQYLNSGRYGDPGSNGWNGYDTSGFKQSPNTGNSTANYLTTASATGPNLTFMIDVPISQYIRQHNKVPLPGPNGKPVVAEFQTDTEVGFVNVQNDRFSMQPKLTLNPLYVPSPATNAPFQVTGNAVINAASPAIYLDAELYPVPNSPADLPDPTVTSFIYQRINTWSSVNVVGGQVVYRPLSAGLLCRYVLEFWDVNGNFVDLSSTPGGTIDLQWGTSTHRRVETFQANLATMAKRYGPPPIGILVHDFLADNEGGIAQSLPPDLSNTRCIVNGLPGSVATMTVYEERLISVTVGS